MPIDVQYLRVIGRLYADRQLALRPGYLTTAPPWTDLQERGRSGPRPSTPAAGCWAASPCG